MHKIRLSVALTYIRSDFGALWIMLCWYHLNMNEIVTCYVQMIAVEQHFKEVLICFCWISMAGYKKSRAASVTRAFFCLDGKAVKNCTCSYPRIGNSNTKKSQESCTKKLRVEFFSSTRLSHRQCKGTRIDVHKYNTYPRFELQSCLPIISYVKIFSSRGTIEQFK